MSSGAGGVSGASSTNATVGVQAIGSGTLTGTATGTATATATATGTGTATATATGSGSGSGATSSGVSTAVALQASSVRASPSSSGSSAQKDQRVYTHASGIVIILQNVVATVNLGVTLDLQKIALKTRNAEFNPERFAAVIMRIRDPKTTALIFSSGKVVVTGAKTEEDSKLAAKKFAKIVQKIGFQGSFKDFKVQNIVGSCDCKFAIRLEGLALTHGKFASYEPELFPGLIYRMVNPKIVLLIFVSGKIVITGAKYKTDIHEAFNRIYPVLLEFKK